MYQGNSSKEKQPHKFRDQSFRQTHGGRDQFPGGEWGSSGEYGRSSQFRESDSSDERIARPYDMDNFKSGRQFSNSRPYASEVDDLDDEEFSGREYNRSRFAEPYTGGQFSRSQYGMGSQYNTGYSPSNQQAQEMSHTGKGPKGYRRSDERIREEVCEVLFHSPKVDASDVEVSVKEGLVTLSGTVKNRYAKREAEICIENLAGVEDVSNELRPANNEARSGNDLQAH